MKQKLSGFLQIMYDLNPDAVGGAMPFDRNASSNCVGGGVPDAPR